MHRRGRRRIHNQRTSVRASCPHADALSLYQHKQLLPTAPSPGERQTAEDAGQRTSVRASCPNAVALKPKWQTVNGCRRSARFPASAPRHRLPAPQRALESPLPRVLAAGRRNQARRAPNASAGFPGPFPGKWGPASPGLRQSLRGHLGSALLRLVWRNQLKLGVACGKSLEHESDAPGHTD